jgi:hypothetical protein
MLDDLRFYIKFLALLSGIVGIVFYYKLPSKKAKLFLFSIWLSALIEAIGMYFSKWTGLLNYCIFNFYTLVLFTIYIFIIKSLLKRIQFICISNLLLVAFPIFYLIDHLLLQNGLSEILTHGYVFGVISITILSTFYLFELFSSNLVLKYDKSIFFWFIIGILIFHIPYLPFMLSLNWFLINQESTIYGIIIFFLNLLMNSIFIIGFIWSEKTYNY